LTVEIVPFDRPLKSFAFRLADHVNELSGFEDCDGDVSRLGSGFAFGEAELADEAFRGRGGFCEVAGLGLRDTLRLLVAEANLNGNLASGLLTPAPDLTAGRNAYWGGTSFTMTYFDPIKVMADVAYGSVSGGGDTNDRSGWMFDLAVDYTGFDFMTPEVFFVYTSGEDDDATNGSERMPLLYSQYWAPGSFWFGGDTLLMGSYGYLNSQTGFWTAGLSLKDISFVEKLSHTINALYVQGTNDKDTANTTVAGYDFVTYGRSLTEEDHIIEFDLNNKYQLYDELALTLDLGYIINGYDKDTWGGIERDDAFKLSTGLAYSF
jgi:hypothetical protein